MFENEDQLIAYTIGGLLMAFIIGIIMLIAVLYNN